MLFSRETIQNRLLPFCGLIAVLTFTASCGSDSNTGGTPTDPGGTNILYQDDFAGTTLAAVWTASIFGGGGTIGIDTGTGQPAPSLYIQSDSTINSQSLVKLSQPYSNVGGVSFTIQAQIDNPGRADKILDAIRITIHDQGRNGAQAGVTIHRSQVGSNIVNITYDVYPKYLPQQVKEWNLVLSPGFHEFRYVVYPDGTAKWFRDGIQRLATLTGVQMLEADLELHLNVHGSNAAAHFDNAVVSR